MAAEAEQREPRFTADDDVRTAIFRDGAPLVNAHHAP